MDFSKFPNVNNFLLFRMATGFGVISSRYLKVDAYGSISSLNLSSRLKAV